MGGRATSAAVNTFFYLGLAAREEGVQMLRSERVGSFVCKRRIRAVPEVALLSGDGVNADIEMRDGAA